MSRLAEEDRHIGQIVRLLGARRWDEAESEIERGLARHPEGAAFLALAADLARKKKKLREAEALLKRARAADALDEQVLTVGAELAFDSGDLETAAKLYPAVFDRKPSSYYASRFVQALNRLERFDEAAETARQMLERYPDHVWLLRGLASAEARRGRKKEAAALYEKIVALDPDDQFSYKELMRLATSDRPGEEAARAVRGLMRVGERGKNVHLRALAADNLRRAGRDAEAAAEYEAALEIDPGNTYALSQLGFCYRRLGQTEKAIETLGRAFLADPGKPMVRTTLESLCRRAGKLDRLLRWVDEAIALHPEKRNLYGIRKRVEKLQEGAEGNRQG